jgi:hypothetical protein
MSRVMRTTVHAVFGLALAGLTIAATAQAGDFYGPPPPGPYPYGGPVYDRPHDGACRFLFERRVDPYGRETMHRIRMCDDGPVYQSVNPAVAPDYGYPPPRYYEPSPSGYYAPRPPAPIGSGYYYN